MKSKRGWLTPQKDSGSFYRVDVGEHSFENDVVLTLGDCNRRISWSFQKIGKKATVRKIKLVKKLIDEIYEYLVPENQR